jgi:hypothetical protein
MPLSAGQPTLAVKSGFQPPARYQTKPARLSVGFPPIGESDTPSGTIAARTSVCDAVVDISNDAHLQLNSIDQFIRNSAPYNSTVKIMQDTQKLAYRVTAAAAALDISRSKLYELMKVGAVGYVCIGTVRRIPYSEIVRISTNGIVGVNAGLQLEEQVHPARRRHLKR